MLSWACFSHIYKTYQLASANIDFLEDGWHFSWGKYIWIGYFSSSGLPDHCSSTIQPSWPSLATTTPFVNHCYSFAILGRSPFSLFLKPTSPLPPNLCNHVFFLPHCLQPLLCFVFYPAFGHSFSYSFFSATLSSQQGWACLHLICIQTHIHTYTSYRYLPVNKLNYYSLPQICMLKS